MNWWQPALAVNAIQASHAARTRATSSTTSRGRASASGSSPTWIRDEIREALVDAPRSAAAPWGVEVAVKVETAGPPWITDTAHPAFQAAFRALEKGFGQAGARRSAAAGPSGSSSRSRRRSAACPRCSSASRTRTSNAHSENESLHLGDFEKAIRSAIHLYAELAAASLPRVTSRPVTRR